MLLSYYEGAERVTSMLMFVVFSIASSTDLKVCSEFVGIFVKFVEDEKNWIVCCPTSFSASLVDVDGLPGFPVLVLPASMLTDASVKFSNALCLCVTIWKPSSSRLIGAVVKYGLLCSNLGLNRYLLAMLALFAWALFFSFWQILHSECQAACPTFPHAVQLGSTVACPWCSLVL